MIVRGMDIDVNFMEELDPYMHQLDRAKVYGVKLQACSPFRDEGKPSFAVNLENGTWIDSGNITDEWHKGSFTKLLSFFREETYWDTEAYLLEKYNIILADADLLKLDLNLQMEAPKKIFEPEFLKQYAFRHPYLEKRGIPERIQRGFKIGYSKEDRAVTFPIFDRCNNLVNVKLRKVGDKRFWYLSDGQPVKQHIFGLNHIYRKQSKVAYIVEGETDCMYLWANGFPSIATFGASMSKKQKQLILSSPIEHLIIAVDNDAVGRDYRNKIAKEFGGLLDVSEIEIPSCYKDVNDTPVIQLVPSCQNPVPITLGFGF